MRVLLVVILTGMLIVLTSACTNDPWKTDCLNKGGHIEHSETGNKDGSNVHQGRMCVKNGRILNVEPRVRRRGEQVIF